MDSTSMAEPRAPYGRHSKKQDLPALRKPVPAESRHGPYDGPTYYGLPALKQPHYGDLIAAYFFVGGISGASQIIAQVADCCGSDDDRLVVRDGRYLAVIGAAASPVFLILDLHTPQRWYNMLRIYRGTSPMSFGSWVLSVFGIFSGLTAAAQLAADWTGRPLFRRLANLLGLPAAAGGGLVCVYTGTLLSSTSVPLWSTGGKLLPVLFAGSAMNTAAAALLAGESLRRQPRALPRLQRVAVLSSGFEALADAALEKRWQNQHVDRPLHDQTSAKLIRTGAKLLGMAAPLLMHGACLLAGKASKRGVLATAVATLAGGYLLRHEIVSSGKRSAQLPEDHFLATQPSRTP